MIASGEDREVGDERGKVLLTLYALLCCSGSFSRSMYYVFRKLEIWGFSVFFFKASVGKQHSKK